MTIETQKRANPEMESLRSAVLEARRFIEKADRLFSELKSSEYVYRSSRRSAARRASLDLTMALAEFRKARA